MLNGLIGTVIGLIIGSIAGYVARLMVGRMSANSVEVKSQQAVANAERDAASIRKDGEIQAKEEMLKARQDFDTSTEERRKEILALEERMAQRETNLDRKVDLIDRKDTAAQEKLAAAEELRSKLEEERREVAALAEEERQILQRIACLSVQEARDLILKRVEKEVHAETASLIRRCQEEAKETAEREGKKVITQAIQRYAASHASDMVTSTVALPSDDMKGRIIGRDGRNIRALEAATGINVLIDDTPEAVVLSGFDPIRREVARQSLEQLITDGRIHPARIEEVVDKCGEAMAETLWNAGEATVIAVGLQGVEPELIRTLGRLKFRTSYSQNVLKHSTEVAHLMGMMAGELGLDTQLAKRVGLFHDIGKALDHDIEGGHATIGADLLKRCGETPTMVNAVAAHHDDVAGTSPYAFLCTAADAISSSRVGARAETTELYVKRLERLEGIANEFEGVSKSYAIQAGREIRILVEPKTVDDDGALVLARDISKQIEETLQYPGQIRVTVIRETRCVEYAK